MQHPEKWIPHILAIILLLLVQNIGGSWPNAKYLDAPTGIAAIIQRLWDMHGTS